MSEIAVDVETPDGVADCTLCAPAGTGPWPGAIILPDIIGVRPAYEEMMRRMAAEGFAVLLPNIYYRTSRMPVFKGALPTFATDEGRATLMEMKATLPADRMTRDGAAYVDFLRGHPAVKGKIGVVGYCMTGRMAMYTAAARPDDVGAAASFHGGWLYTAEPDSPHHLLPRMKAHLYFGHASDDSSMTAEDIGRLQAALKAWGGQFESETYPAKHGWCLSDFPIHDREQAERAWGKLLALFKESL